MSKARARARAAAQGGQPNRDGEPRGDQARRQGEGGDGADGEAESQRLWLDSSYGGISAERLHARLASLKLEEDATVRGSGKRKRSRWVRQEKTRREEASHT